MSKLPDYYKILEIEITADHDTIKKAYKKMALKYHPDRNRGGTREKDSEETFKMVSEAYAVLSDPEKRREYDSAMRGGVGGVSGMGGMNGFDGTRFHRQPMNHDDVFNMFNQFFHKTHFQPSPFGPGFHSDFNSPFFDNFFGSPSNTRSPFSHHQPFHQQRHQQQHQQHHNRARNIHVDTDEDEAEDLFNNDNGNGHPNSRPTKITHKISLFLSFKETVYGTERQIHFPIKVECGHCQGTGSSTKQREFATCQRCNGNGRITNFLLAFTCDVCNGHGVILKNTCNYCQGEGLMNQQYEDTILIPAGISNGTTQTAIFKINKAKSNTYDEHELIIKFQIEQHPFFQREGNNVIISVPLSTTQALFGCNIDVPTIYGKTVQITVPNYESQSKYGLVIHKHGFKDPDGQKVGDMICNFKIDFPNINSITPRERELYKEIAQIEKTRLTKNQSQYYDFMIQWNGEQTSPQTQKHSKI